MKQQLHGQAILKRLPSGPVSVVEIGVAAGELSQFLLVSRPDLTLHMVDSWRYRSPGDPYRLQSKKVGDFNGVRTREQVAQDRQAAQAVADQFKGRCVIHPLDSLEAADRMPDGMFDLVFVDADHRFEATLEDCHAWRSKVRPGGYIGGHDIDRFRDDGVRLAVDAFASATGLHIETDQDWTWFARTPQPVGGQV